MYSIRNISAVLFAGILFFFLFEILQGIKNIEDVLLENQECSNQNVIEHVLDDATMIFDFFSSN